MGTSSSEKRNWEIIWQLRALFSRVGFLQDSNGILDDMVNDVLDLEQHKLIDEYLINTTTSKGTYTKLLLFWETIIYNFQLKLDASFNKADVV